MSFSVSDDAGSLRVQPAPRRTALYATRRHLVSAHLPSHGGSTTCGFNRVAPALLAQDGDEPLAGRAWLDTTAASRGVFVDRLPDRAPGGGRVVGRPRRRCGRVPRPLPDRVLRATTACSACETARTGATVTRRLAHATWRRSLRPFRDRTCLPRRRPIVRRSSASRRPRRDHAWPGASPPDLRRGGDRRPRRPGARHARRPHPDRRREVLGAFPYQPNEAVLHTRQMRLLPRRRRAWASWNYHLDARADGVPTVSYWMNRLQTLHAQRDYVVTLNRTDAIDPARVIRTIDYAHPVYRLGARAAQARHAEVNTARTSFCGGLLGLGLSRGRAAERPARRRVDPSAAPSGEAIAGVSDRSRRLRRRTPPRAPAEPLRRRSTTRPPSTRAPGPPTAATSSARNAFSCRVVYAYLDVERVSCAPAATARARALPPHATTSARNRRGPAAGRRARPRRTPGPARRPQGRGAAAHDPADVRRVLQPDLALLLLRRAVRCCRPWSPRSRTRRGVSATPTSSTAQGAGESLDKATARVAVSADAAGLPCCARPLPGRRSPVHVESSRRRRARPSTPRCDLHRRAVLREGALLRAPGAADARADLRPRARPVGRQARGLLHPHPQGRGGGMTRAQAAARRVVFTLLSRVLPRAAHRSTTDGREYPLRPRRRRGTSLRRSSTSPRRPGLAAAR